MMLSEALTILQQLMERWGDGDVLDDNEALLVDIDWDPGSGELPAAVIMSFVKSGQEQAPVDWSRGDAN